MKHSRWPLMAAAASLFLSATALAGDATKPDCLSRAQTILTALDSGEFEQARVDFDARMQAALSAEQLRQVWVSLPEQAGPRLLVAPGRERATGAMTTAIIPLHYEKAWLELQVSCAADGSVGGLFVRPGAAPATPPAADAAHDWTEREIAVKAGELTLPGTLTLPKDAPVAGVVLVHGSGAHDQDESIGPNRVFRDLAHGLAERGIAVVRYEKRSHAHPESFAGKAFTVDEEVVDDAVSALKLAAAQPELRERPIYLIGHSLGALLAPRIAARQNVAGLVLMAAPARSLTEMITQQSRYIANLDGSISKDEQAGLDQLQPLVAKIDALTEADRGDTTLLFGAPAAYWLDLASYSPFVQARKLQKPILLLQGESDYQVTMRDDYQTWQERMHSAEGYSAQSFGGLSHLFMPAGAQPGPADYERPSHVDTRVIDAIATWIKSV